MKQLGLIGAVEAVVPASQLKKLAGVPGLIVTPNANVKLSGVGTSQLWPYESGNALMWPGDTTTYAGKTPAIAIVDSGIQHARRLRRSRHRERQPLDDRGQHLAQRRARSRHVRGRHRGGRFSRL